MLRRFLSFSVSPERACGPPDVRAVFLGRRFMRGSGTSPLRVFPMTPVRCLQTESRGSRIRFASGVPSGTAILLVPGHESVFVFHILAGRASPLPGFSGFVPPVFFRPSGFWLHIRAIPPGILGLRTLSFDVPGRSLRAPTRLFPVLRKRFWSLFVCSQPTSGRFTLLDRSLAAFTGRIVRLPVSG
jgi:hypothetical protein